MAVTLSEKLARYIKRDIPRAVAKSIVLMQRVIPAIRQRQSALGPDRDSIHRPWDRARADTLSALASDQTTDTAGISILDVYIV